MRPPDPTEQFREIVGRRGIRVVDERDEPSLCQITALPILAGAPPVPSGTCEVCLSPNKGIWTPIIFSFPTTFRLVPGSVVWARAVNVPLDTVPAVDVSIRVWPDYLWQRSKRRKSR